MLTNEQQDIINCDLNNGKLKLVQAFAGTGKTTTLIELAKVHKDKKILYLSFNKSLIENNDFDDNVDANTIHGMAYKAFENDPKFVQGKLNIQKVCKIMSVNSSDADTILKAFNYFCASTNTFPKMKHLTHVNGSSLNKPKYYLTKVQELWKKIENFEIEIPHDAYLKLYMLRDLQLDYQLVLVDEIQDVTPCILKILLRNNVPKVFVGDIHQQIYGFRNVINPYNKKYCNNFEYFQLTKSFRYGGNILKVVNQYLNEFKDETCKIDGLMDTNIHYLNTFKDNYTYICNTNKQLLNYALYLANKQIHFKFLGKIVNWTKESEIYEMLKDLKEKGVVHEYLAKKFNITSYDEALLLFEECKNYKWINRMNVVDEHSNIYGTLEKYHCNNAEIGLITCHMSKGLEFDNVVMGNDFKKVVFKKTIVYNHDSDVYNLLYVCMTRAKKNLVLNYDIINFIRNCNQNFFETSQGTCHPCIICGKDSHLVLSYNLQKLPYYVSKVHKVSVDVCNDCCEGYKKDTLKILY